MRNTNGLSIELSNDGAGETHPSSLYPAGWNTIEQLTFQMGGSITFETNSAKEHICTFYFANANE
jgi:hypothetical protein